jgi:hypothetical protein
LFGSHSRDALLTIFSLAVFFSLISSGSLSVFPDRPSPMGSSMIISASATTDGGDDEGGGEQGEEEQSNELDETAPPETDADTEPDTETEDAQQSPMSETLPPDSSAIAPTLTPEPTSEESPLTPGMSPTQTPGLTARGFIPDVICAINPSLPECRQTPTPTPTPTPNRGIRTVMLCDPPNCECKIYRVDVYGFKLVKICTPAVPELPQPPIGGPPPTPVLPQSLCIINPNHPQCQSTSTSIPLGRSPPTTPGSQSSTLDLTRILTPTATPPHGSQLRSLTVTPTPTPGITPTQTTTPTPTPAATPILTQTPTPTPTQTPTPPTPIIITNINNNQVTVRNDGGFTVQDLQGAITTTPDCPPQSATALLGPSTIENGGARILAAFDPCILNDGTVVMNLPDEQGIQLVAANIVGGQTTQSAVVPIQRVAPITEGQTLYSVDLDGQMTGVDPATGAQVTMNGNINSLFLLNLAGQEVELSGDNSVALNAVLS